MERAAELFAERGVAATGLDEVLAAAGAGKGQLYHYFRDRNELVEAAVGLRCAQVLAGLTQALGTVASLAALEQALAGFAAEYERMGLPGCPIGSLAAEVAKGNENARRQPLRRSMPGSGCSPTRWNGCVTGGSCTRTRPPPKWLRRCSPPSKGAWC